MTRREEEEKEETDRLGGWGGTRRGHLERDETWRAVEIGMERCDVETVGERGGGESQRSLGFETVLGFLSKGRDLQDLIDSVNLRTLIPKRFCICGFNTRSPKVLTSSLGFQRLLYYKFSTRLPALPLHTDFGQSLIFVD